MPALTCPTCDEFWPKGKRYQSCPRCDTQTRLVEEAEAIPKVEADELVKAYDGFKVWLAKHPDEVFEVLDLSRYDRFAELERIPVLEEKAA